MEVIISDYRDTVDRLTGQWQSQRPDLDLGAMALIARLKRCSQLVGPMLDEVYAEHGLSAGDFDVLATLRRSGAPYCLSPTELFDSLLLTSGTMTHRLKRMEGKGLIERIANPDDARSMLVRLSAKGVQIIEACVGAHVANETRILSVLTPQQQNALSEGLRALLVSLER